MNILRAKKTHWHVRRTKVLFFTQEWFKLGLDCHATGLCTLDLFNLYHISLVCGYDGPACMMNHVQTDKQPSLKLCPYHGDPCTYKVQTCGPPLEGAITLSSLWSLSSQEALRSHTWLTALHHVLLWMQYCSTLAASAQIK